MGNRNMGKLFKDRGVNRHRYRYKYGFFLMLKYISEVNMGLFGPEVMHGIIFFKVDILFR